MSASGKKEDMSPAELRQRSLAGQASSTHGAYAFRDNGEKALEPSKRSRLIELREITQDKSSILALMQEKAADGVLMYELFQSYFVKEVLEKKVPITDIPAIKYLPVFYNAMERALRDLLYLMPDDKASISEELVKIRTLMDESENDK